MNFNWQILRAFFFPSPIRILSQSNSPLVEAIVRALFDRHRVTGEVAKHIQPWGTSGIGPRVTLEFEADGETYRLQKRFVVDPAAQVERLVDGKWVPISKGDEADDFVRQLLHGERPARGTSRPEHWGIARALWVLQTAEAGALRGSVEVPESVRAQIRTLLPEAPATSVFGEVLSRIEEAVSEYFTERGHLRRAADSEIRRLGEDIGELTSDLEKARAEYSEAQKTAQDLLQVQAELSELENQMRRDRAAIEQYRREAHELASLKSEIEDAKQEVDEAESGRRELEERLREYDRAVKRCSQAREALDKVEQQLREAEVKREAARQNEMRAATDVKRRKGELRKAQAEYQRGHKIARAKTLRRQAAELEEKLETIRKLEQQLSDARAALAALPKVTDDELEKARQLATDTERLKAQLETVGLSVTVTLERAQPVVFKTHEGEQAWEGRAGDEHTEQAGGELAVHFPGVARLQIRSNAPEPRRMQEELQATAGQLHELLARYGAESVKDLGKLLRRRQRSEQEIETLERQIAAAVRPHADVAEAHEQLDRIRGQLEGLTRELDMSLDDLQRADEPDLNALEEARETAEGLLDDAERELDEIRNQLEEYMQTEADLKDQRAQKKGDLDRHDQQAAMALERAGCSTREELVPRIEQARGQARKARQRLQALKDPLPAPEEDPEELLKAAERAIDDAHSRRDQLREARAVYEDRLEALQRVGQHEVIAELEEQLADKRQRLHEVLTKAYALKLLRELLRHHRAKMVQPALPKLQEKIDRMLAAITGMGRRVVLSPEDLSIEAVVEEQWEARHPVDDLSGGAKEQLGLVLRIALGEAYADQYGRTPVVLDDALLFTDPLRHDRVKEILRRATKKVQVIILTSHPQRYLGLVPEQCQFDLAALLQQAAPGAD